MNKTPNGWHEVNVETYCQLKQMDESNPSFFTRQIEILSILTDTYPDDWSDMDIEDLTNKTHQITWLRNPPTNGYKLDIDEYKCIDINKLTFGEFVDLEYYFTNNMYENLPMILATVYRKYELDEFKNVKYESLGSYDLNERITYFNKIPIEWVYGIIYEFYTFKTNLYTSYSTLFVQPVTAEEMAEYEEIKDDFPLTPEEVEAEEFAKVAEKWSWENIVYRITNGDITKYDVVMNMSVIFIFNQLSFLKDMKK